MPAPEEIKSIAREYARCICIGTFNAEQRAEDEKIEYDFALPVLEWLSERYCLVEKSKVNVLQSEIFKEIMDSHEAEDWQGVAHYVLDVMPRSFNEIFGSSLFNEEKE